MDVKQRGVYVHPPLFLVTLRAGRGCGPPTPTPPSLPVLGSSFVHFVKFEPAGWSIIIKYNYLFSPIVCWSISCWNFYLRLQFSSLTFILEKDHLLSSSLSAPLHHIFTLNFLEIISFSSLCFSSSSSFVQMGFVSSSSPSLFLPLLVGPPLGASEAFAPEDWSGCEKPASLLVWQSDPLRGSFWPRWWKSAERQKRRKHQTTEDCCQWTTGRTVTADWTFTDGDDRLRWLGFRDNWISEAVASETGKTSPNLFVSRSQRSLAIERETI